MKTAILTSSETFGSYVFHPGKWLVLWAEGKVIAGHTIHALVFPSVTLLPEGVEDPGTTIVNRAIKERADVILSFGLSSSVRGFRMERSASNWSENKYCQPYEQAKPLEKRYPVKEQVHIDLSRWDVEKVYQLADAHTVPLEREISDDPGQYSCNAWMYRTLKAMQRQQVTIPYLFIHTACTEETIEHIPDFPRDRKTIITKEDLIHCLEIFLQSYR